MKQEDSVISASCSGKGRSGIYDNGGITVVELSGSWPEMGRQYGLFTKQKLMDVLSYIDRQLAGREDRTRQAAEIADKLYEHYPQHFKAFMEASADSSGLGLEKIKLCNAVEYVEGAFFCSAIATWGDYSQDKLIFGRNYDAVSYSEISDDIIVTVYHPEGELSVATIGYAGEVYCVNGINQNGIFLELNNGMPSAGAEIDWSLCPSTSQLLELLFMARSMDDVDTFFLQTPSFASFLIGACTRAEARCYEWCRAGVRRGDAVTPDGLMVSTNHYVHPEWSYPVPSDSDSWDSITRRKNLCDAALANKGSMDVSRMQNLMSSTLAHGGPFSDLTRYQLVFVPEDMLLFINTPSLKSPWAAIDLAAYLCH